MSYDAMPEPEKCQCGHSQEQHFLCTTKGFLGGYKPVPAYYGRCRRKKCICHLEYAYGYVSLNRMVTDGGGVERILPGGTKRELYHQLHAYLAGLAAKKGA